MWLIRDEITKEKVHCNFPAKCSTNVRPLDWRTNTFQFLAELLAQNRNLEVNESRSSKLLGLYCPLVVAKKRAEFLASWVLLGLAYWEKMGRLGKREKFKVPATKAFPSHLKILIIPKHASGSTLPSKRAVLLTFSHHFSHAVPLPQWWFIQPLNLFLTHSHPASSTRPP